jgi:hypothetical protein
VDPSIKNLREWVGLLFCLFCALDIAGLQYGVMLAQTATSQPDYETGQIAAMLGGSRGDWHQIFVTPRQLMILHGVLAAAAVSLLTSLSLIVFHGMRRVRNERRLEILTQRKR